MNKENNLPQHTNVAANHIIESLHQSIFSGIHDIFTSCQSPIEVQLLSKIITEAWEGFGRSSLILCSPELVCMIAEGEHGLRCKTVVSSSNEARDFSQITRSCYVIETQVPIGNYRVDFLVSSIATYVNADSRIFRLVVECDGHDYHEKTKEQAKHDKSRDRELKMNGYEVFRFTGSEIFNDPEKCASQVINFLVKKELDADAKSLSEQYAT